MGGVVVVGVEEDDGLEVEAELFPGDELGELGEGAETAGEDDGGVGVSHHLLLAGVHVGGDDEAGHAWMCPAFVDHEAGYDAEGLTAGGHAGVGGGAHEAHIAGAVDEGDVVTGKELSEADGGLEVWLGYLVAAGAVDADGAYHGTTGG